MASLIESVKARKRGAQDFEGYYSQLCALQDTCPLSAVKAHLADGVLDINADRVRQADWMPILSALRINRSLQFIAIRSYFESSGKQEDSKSRSQTQIRRQPPIRSRDIGHRLSLALRECLSSSEQIHHLELQGLLLREKNIESLCKGLAQTKCLQHLSLEYCRIGDTGVECVFQCIKNIPTIVSLNLTAAGLTWKSADLLAKLIKHQATRRHTEAWKDSLRYRRPDLDRMPGIRRITINNNPLINDKGALALAEALKDDLWLKALDMQNCGVSNVGATAFLDTLHQNTSVVVLDLRKNQLIDRDLVKAVIEQVMINSGGQDAGEYQWLRARSSKEPSSKSKRRRSKSSSASMQKVQRSRSTTKAGSSQRVERRARSKSANSITIHTTNSKASSSDFHPPVTKPGAGFIPWRTAARANQRSKDMLLQAPGSPNGSSTPTRTGGSSIHVHLGSNDHSSELDTSIKDSTGQMSTSAANDESYDVAIGRKIKDLQVESEELRRRLYIESRARSAADARIVELEVENSRLRHQVQLLEARGPNSPLKPGKQDAGRSEDGAGADEALLDSIEDSFRKFHGFLDLLRDAGLGQLCTLVGMTTQDIGHPLVKSILKSHQPSDMPGVTSAPAASVPAARTAPQPYTLSSHSTAMPQQPLSYQPNLMYSGQAMMSSVPATASALPSGMSGQAGAFQPGSMMHTGQALQAPLGNTPQPFPGMLNPGMANQGMVNQGVPGTQFNGQVPNDQSQIPLGFAGYQPTQVGFEGLQPNQVGFEGFQPSQVGFEGLQQPHISDPTMPGSYPSVAVYGQPGYSTMMAYPPRGIPVYEGQPQQTVLPPASAAPVSGPPAQQTILPTLPLVHQQPASDIPATTSSNDPGQASTVYPQTSLQDSDVRTANLPASNVKNTASAVDVPPETLSSTEGVFVPKVVQISSEPRPRPSNADGKTSSRKTNGTTLRIQHELEEQQDLDDIAPHHMDSRPGHTHPALDEESHSDQGLEPELQKDSNLIDFDLGHLRRVPEFDFGGSVESTPRDVGYRDAEDSPRVESATPRGIGSPTESDHSARGGKDSSHGGSFSHDYSDDFEGGGHEDDDSEVGEDLFAGSGGSLPGFTSDEEF